MEVEVYSGFLNYCKSGHLGKKKVKKYGILYMPSSVGSLRIELYDSKEAFFKKENSKKHVHLINLEQCCTITNEKLADGKKMEHVIHLHAASEEKQHTLSWDTAEDMTTWLQYLRSVIFGRTDGSDTSFIFKVDIKPNEISEKLNLRGTYFLSITHDDIELLDRHTRKQIFKWPLHLLRKYGRDKQEFSLEAGRRCPTGAGMFCFKTDHYNAIFQEVECNIKSHASRTKHPRTGSTSSTSSYSKGTSNKFQMTTDRPSSPRVPPSSVYDNPLDAKQSSDNSSDVYSEPVNIFPSPTPIGKTRQAGKGKNSTGTKQDGKKSKSKGAMGQGPFQSAPRKPPRKTSTPSSNFVAEATYAEPQELIDGQNDLHAEYSHLNIGGNIPIADAEYDSIDFNSTLGQDAAYATTAGAPPLADAVYDRVQR